MNFDEWLERRMEEIRVCANEYAEAKAKVVYLEEFKKSKLAILMKQFEHLHKSSTAQEREARASKEYMQVIEGLREAVEIQEKKRWELELTKMRFEAWRTNQATQRVERGAYGVR